MNELNREVVLNDLLNALKAQGEIRSTEKDYETDEDYVEVDGQIYTFFITIEITERPYISYYRSATYWPVDQASPAESETSGKFRFYITKITCFNEDGDEYNLSDILTPEDINTIEANMDFDEDEFTDGVDDLYESKKIRLSEQDITYMVKRVLKEAYNNKKKAQHTMNESRIIKINENMIKQMVETCVKTLLKENDMDENRPPFLDSEMAMGDHERCSSYRITDVIREFTLKLRQAIIDDEYGDKIDRMFVPKIDQAIRGVLTEYGISN